MMRAHVGVWTVAGVLLTTAAPTLAMDSMTKGEGMMGTDGKMYMMQATDKQCGDMAKSKM